jgi:hypothetical protein
MRISSCSSGTNGCARGGILRALNRPRKAQPAGSTPSDGHHRAVVGFGEVFYIGKVDTFDRGRFVPLPYSFSSSRSKVQRDTRDLNENSNEYDVGVAFSRA